MGWGGLDVDTEEAFLEHAPGVAYIVMIKGVWDGVSWMLKLKGLFLEHAFAGGACERWLSWTPFLQRGTGRGVLDVARMGHSLNLLLRAFGNCGCCLVACSFQGGVGLWWLGGGHRMDIP